MRERSTRGGGPGQRASLGLGLGIIASVLTAGPAVFAETRQPPPTEVASPSAAPAERSQEAILRELAEAPFLPPEIFTDLLYAAPAPVIGGLGVEVE